MLGGIAVRILNLRVAAIGRRPKFDLSILGPPVDASLESAGSGARQVWYEGRWWETPVYRRLDIPTGARISGPAVLEQPDTTIFIDPDLDGEVDRFGNLILSRKASRQ